MFITKCDTCAKEIPRGEALVAGAGSAFTHHTFYHECGAPILVFLEERGLTQHKQEKIDAPHA